MALELFIGQGRARPRLFLVLLLLFLILGTWLASAVTGADYVRGSGTADVPDDRISSAPTAFSAQDDRCLLVAVVVGGEPQAFLLWRLRPALAAMSVTAYDPNLWLPDGAGGTATLADRFGEGGRGGCEAVCDTLTKARRGTPTHYLVVTETTLRALMNRLGDTITLSLPEGLEAVAAEQLVAFLSIPADDYPTGRAAFVRMGGAVRPIFCGGARRPSDRRFRGAGQRRRDGSYHLTRGTVPRRTDRAGHPKRRTSLHGNGADE